MFHRSTKNWDKVLVILLAYPYTLGPLLIAAMEGSKIKDKVQNDHKYMMFIIVGIVINIVSAIFLTYCMQSNKFFSSMVRIQSDRNHAVCNTGPYKYIRHPGYTSMIPSILLGNSLLFYNTTNNSRKQIELALFMLAVLVLRTHLEDNALQKELNGYKEYANKVKWRLIPFIY